MHTPLSTSRAPMATPVARARRRRPAVLALLLAVAALVGTACDPEKERVSTDRVAAVRAAHGARGLVRTAELDAKARAQADRMAAAGAISHSADLAAGVPAGWTKIGENVAAGPTIEAAQQALENSPPHLANMVDPAFTEIGVGVTVAPSGTVYLVQVYVTR